MRLLETQGDQSEHSPCRLLLCHANNARFKEIIKVVKDTSASTKESLQTLCKI